MHWGYVRGGGPCPTGSRVGKVPIVDVLGVVPRVLGVIPRVLGLVPRVLGVVHAEDLNVIDVQPIVDVLPTGAPWASGTLQRTQGSGRLRQSKTLDTHGV